MSSQRYHIPFPSNFLSLNTPPKRASVSSTTPLTPPEAGAHSFLSNNPISARKSSMSSNSSDTPSSRSNSIDQEAVTLPQGFLPLNSKFTPPPADAPAPPSGFLSNRATAPRRDSV